MAQTIGTADAVPAETPGRNGWIARFRVIAVSWEAIVWWASLPASSRFYDLGTRDEPRREPAALSSATCTPTATDHNPMMHGPFFPRQRAHATSSLRTVDFTARHHSALFGMGTLAMIYGLRPLLEHRRDCGGHPWCW